MSRHFSSKQAFSHNNNMSMSTTSVRGVPLPLPASRDLRQVPRQVQRRVSVEHVPEPMDKDLVKEQKRLYLEEMDDYDKCLNAQFALKDCAAAGVGGVTTELQAGGAPVTKETHQENIDNAVVEIAKLNKYREDVLAVYRALL